MYVDYQTYEGTIYYSEKISEGEYEQYAPIADMLIDHWTLNRVGDAVRGDKELPLCIINLYSAIIANLPSAIKESKAGTGAAVSSFSNGIDSYGFDLSSTIADKMYSSLQFLIEAQLIEWISSCVGYRGGAYVR